MLVFYYQDKAVALTTYAICGFSSFMTFLIFVGIWAVLSKGKVRNLSTMVLRAYMNTNIACFITACVAGEEIIESCHAKICLEALGVVQFSVRVS